MYREKLDLLKEWVEARRVENIEDIAMDVSNAYLRMSRSFRNESPPVERPTKDNVEATPESETGS